MLRDWFDGLSFDDDENVCRSLFLLSSYKLWNERTEWVEEIPSKNIYPQEENLT